MKKASLRTLGAGVLACAALVGCNSDAFKYKPTLAARADTVTAFALNGTATTLPTAVNVAAPQTESDTIVLKPLAVPSNGSSSFDFAVDVNSAGQAVVFSPPLVVRTNTRRVGLQKLTTDFDALTTAPTTGFTYDSATVTLGAGDVLVVQAQRALAGERCYERSTYGYDPVLYAKAQVLSVNTADRSVKFRVVLNPNCGFRGLKPGSISGN